MPCITLGIRGIRSRSIVAVSLQTQRRFWLSQVVTVCGSDAKYQLLDATHCRVIPAFSKVKINDIVEVGRARHSPGNE